MTIYIAVCQYIWCNRKHIPKHFGLSTNKPFTNKEDAYKELRHAAEKAIFDMQEWSTACEKDQYSEIPVIISCWYSVGGKPKELSQTSPLSQTALPKEKITNFDIRTKDPMYFWSGHIEKQEIRAESSQK